MLRDELNSVRRWGSLMSLFASILAAIQTTLMIGKAFGATWIHYGHLIGMTVLTGIVMILYAFLWRGKACLAAEYRDNYLKTLNWQSDTISINDAAKRVEAAKLAGAMALAERYYCQLLLNTMRKAHAKLEWNEALGKPLTFYFASVTPAGLRSLGPYLVYINVAEPDAEPWYVPYQVSLDGLRVFTQHLVSLEVDKDDFERTNRIAKAEGRKELLDDYLKYVYDGIYVWEKLIGEKLAPSQYPETILKVAEPPTVENT